MSEKNEISEYPPTPQTIREIRPVAQYRYAFLFRKTIAPTARSFNIAIRIVTLLFHSSRFNMVSALQKLTITVGAILAITSPVNANSECHILRQYLSRSDRPVDLRRWAPPMRIGAWPLIAHANERQTSLKVLHKYLPTVAGAFDLLGITLEPQHRLDDSVEIAIIWHDIAPPPFVSDKVALMRMTESDQAWLTQRILVQPLGQSPCALFVLQNKAINNTLIISIDLMSSEKAVELCLQKKLFEVVGLSLSADFFIDPETTLKTIRTHLRFFLQNAAYSLDQKMKHLETCWPKI